MKKIAPTIGVVIILAGVKLYTKTGGDAMWTLPFSLLVAGILGCWTLYKRFTEPKNEPQQNKLEKALDTIFGTLLAPRYDHTYWQIKTFPEKLFVAVMNLLILIIFGLFSAHLLTKTLFLGIVMLPLAATCIASVISNLREAQKFGSVLYAVSAIICICLSVASFTGFIGWIL